MGQLKQSRVAAKVMGRVCLTRACLAVKQRNLADWKGEKLSERARRLDFELEKSRADLGATGEPG